MPASGSPSTQLRKITTIESVATLIANGVFIGPWHDSQIDGTVFVVATAFSPQAGSANAIIIQESDDFSNASLTRQVTTGGVYTASTVGRAQASIKARYWRVQFTNGAVQQASFELTSCAMNAVPLPSVGTSAGEMGVPVVVAIVTGNTSQIDNTNIVTNIPNNAGATNGPSASLMMYGGAFSAAPDVVRQFWSKARTPTVFKQITKSTVGSTSIWLPGTGNKFRLLRYRIVVGASAIMAAATDLTITLLDNALDIGQDYIVRIPAAALASGVNYDTGWVDLGTFGILSAAINQNLNVNLSAALTGGLVNVLVAGTEE